MTPVTGSRYTCCVDGSPFGVNIFSTQP
jgi:hypothetical protein